MIGAIVGMMLFRLYILFAALPLGGFVGFLTGLVLRKYLQSQEVRQSGDEHLQRRLLGTSRPMDFSLGSLGFVSMTLVSAMLRPRELDLVHFLHALFGAALAVVLYHFLNSRILRMAYVAGIATVLIYILKWQALVFAMASAPPILVGRAVCTHLTEFHWLVQLIFGALLLFGWLYFFSIGLNAFENRFQFYLY